MNFGIKVKISQKEAIEEASLNIIKGNIKASKIISCIMGYQGEKKKNETLLYLQILRKKRLGNDLNIIENTALTILENDLKKFFQEK